MEHSVRVDERRLMVGRLSQVLRIDLVLVVILLLAAGLRFSGLDWDRGFLLHPDERRIVMVVRELQWPQRWDWSLVLSPDSPLNPRFFAYGSLPFYLLRLLATLIDPELTQLYMLGRMLSASFDLLTVAVVYQIGQQLGGRWVARLAAAFLALSVLAIQLAHFLTVEPMLTFLWTLTFLVLLRLARTGSYSTGLVAGGLFGLALATKTSALPLAFLLWLAWALWTVRSPGLPDLKRGIGGFVLSLVAAAVVLVLAQPYALIDWTGFAAGLSQESAMASGSGDYPYTRQFIGTLPYLYQLRELLVWSLGLPLGLSAVAGVLWLSVRGLRERQAPDLLLLAWIWPYWLVVGSFHAKFSRYMSPLLPVLCLVAALFLRYLWERTRSGSGLRKLVWGWQALVLGMTLLYALAFTGLYLRPHPRLEASDWICSRVPARSVLAVEYWDDPLPARGPGMCGRRYEYHWMNPYAPDDDEKLDHLVDSLHQADYIVLSSHRLYATISRLPERYPLTTRYYQRLFEEALGFRLVDVRADYPRLGPVAIVHEPLNGLPLTAPPLLQALRPAPLVLNLGRADESYSVYDHPRTLVFKKEVGLTPAELRSLLTETVGE